MKSSPQLPAEKSSFTGLRLGLVILFLVLEFAIIAHVIRQNITSDPLVKIPGYTPWSEEVVETVSKIPVQDGGRVKPFSTYSRFQLLQFLGGVSVKIERGGEKQKITASEWMLDCMFRPDYADQMPVFRIDDTDLFKGLGFDASIKERRQRFSFNEIKPGYDKLLAKAEELSAEVEEYQKRKGKINLNAEEEKVLEDKKKITQFARQLRQYESLTVMLNFAREGMGIDPDTIPPGVKDKEQFQKFSYWMENFEDIRYSISQATADNNGEIPRSLEQTLMTMQRHIGLSQYGVPWIPPYDPTEKEWKTVGNVIAEEIAKPDLNLEPVVADLKSLESLTKAAEEPDSDEFLSQLKAWSENLTARIDGRDLNETLGLHSEVLWIERSFDDIITSEISYYNKRYFQKGLVYFIIAFVISILAWVVTEGRVFNVVKVLTGIFFTVGVYYLVIGITHRSWIMGRPPVGNLYDTIPFITAGAVIVLGIAEVITRRRLLISLGAFFGAAGLFLAFRYEFGDGSDNMDPLVAVLNSNYWLATHVVTVTLGYSGALVACFISQIYLHLRLAGFAKDKSFRRFIHLSLIHI